MSPNDSATSSSDLVGETGGAVDWSYHTPHPADCVSFCPYPALTHLLLCGTYLLDESCRSCDTSGGQVKRGSVCLLDCVGRSCLQQVDTAAVLDIGWRAHLNDHVDNYLAAAALSDGTVRLLRLIDDNTHQQQTSAWRLCCVGDWCCHGDDGGDDSMVLTLAWSPDGNRLLCTDTRGRVHLLQLSCGVNGAAGVGFVSLWSAQCNDNEPWACGFSSLNADSVVYTGGDDCTLRAFDIRESRQLWARRPHQSGVTCLLTAGNTGRLVHSGGYDGAVNTWDERQWRGVVSSVDTGGGVWRLKARGRHSDRLLLAACMHAGACVLSGDGSAIVAGLRGAHHSMVYGADWSCAAPSGHTDGHLTLATCSFYDQKLCLWRACSNVIV